MCCQAPHSDGLLHPGDLSVTLRAGSAPRPSEFLEVTWDSEGAWAVEFSLGVLALRKALSLHGVLQARNAAKRGGDGNAPLSNTATSCLLI